MDQITNAGALAPLYIHGLEGGPLGNKGTFIRDLYGRLGPDMPAHADPDQITRRPRCFETCYELARAELEAHPASVLVGSSFGGAITLALLQRGAWSGPVVLLAPAAVRYELDPALPSGCHAIIIHDPNDDLVPYSDSELIARSNPCAVELWSSDGGHKLKTITHNGLLKRAVETQLARAI